MAQFDVYVAGDGPSYVVDVQTDILRDFKTRLVVPLMDASKVPPALKRLHPQFDFHGQTVTMATHLMATVPSAELRRVVGTLAHERHAIIGAIDFLLTGS